MRPISLVSNYYTQLSSKNLLTPSIEEVYFGVLSMVIIVLLLIVLICSHHSYTSFCGVLV